MRATILALAVVALVPPVADAQEWIDFESREDRFTANFPGQPTVTSTTYKSQFGADLPARVYSARRGPERYSLTVVDYRNIEKILAEKARSCPEGSEVCRGGFSSTGPGYSWADRAGAMIFASWNFIKRDARVTDYLWNNVNQVVGHQVHLINNGGKSRTMAAIYMHDDRLYILEGTVPEGYAEPGLFQQSLGFIDASGNAIRYDSHYVNGYPPPTYNGGKVRTDGGAGGARYGGVRLPADR
jgi:hypothetical protein